MTQAKPITPYQVRKIILEQSKRAHVGHIGSALSVVEILTALYNHILNIPDPDDPNRDRFILSKGHAALALYAILYLRQWISLDDLNTFCGDDSYLGVHPEHQVKGIDFSSGSLGQGLTMGVGAALAARLQSSKRQTYVLISDAECNEGAVWEAAMFAAHHHLSNLVAILDLNGQQAFGHTTEVIHIADMAARWREFGWDVREVAGHDETAIAKQIQAFDTQPAKPHLLIANTTFGRGVSYMHNKIRWHYMPMTDEEYQQALQEIEALQ